MSLLKKIIPIANTITINTYVLKNFIFKRRKKNQI